VVGIGGEQQAVLTVEALFVAGVAPGFAVAGDEVFEPVDTGQATALLDRKRPPTSPSFLT